MYIRILAIDKELYAGNADALSVPAASGEITILENHVPLVSLLKAGKVTVRHGEKSKEEFSVRGGFVEVNPEKVTVLAE
jgi:F-type H+-transporting ATPase subunit epsilon